MPHHQFLATSPHYTQKESTPGRMSSVRESLAGVPVSETNSSTPLPFGSILRPRRRHGLPLHVEGRIGTATGERSNVIDHVAGPAVRVAGLPHKLSARMWTAPD